MVRVIWGYLGKVKVGSLVCLYSVLVKSLDLGVRSFEFKFCYGLNVCILVEFVC